MKVEIVAFWGGEVSGSGESQRLAQCGSAPSLFEGLKALGLEQRDRGRRCEESQQGPRGLSLAGCGADVAGEDDIALQFRGQPAHKLGAGYKED